jgi:DNA polymerase III subunit delta'
MSVVNKAVLAQLAQLYASGRLAHAYVFIGPKGIGKRATALALAQLVNCGKKTADPTTCDCVSCRKIASGNHPDMFFVKKADDKAGISIKQVQGLIERLEFRAVEAELKFAIIEDAEGVSEEAANAFLKTLEEPRPGTILVLLTALPDALLSTIRSRCQSVRFAAMTQGALAEELKAGQDMPSDDAVVLSAFAQGSPGRAVALGQDFLERRRRVLDAFLGVGDTESFVKLAGTDRESAREALHVVLMACRDALLAKTGAGHKIVNRDRQVEIKRFAEKYTAEALSAHADRIVEAMGRVDGNQNVKSVLTVVRELMQER